MCNAIHKTFNKKYIVQNLSTNYNISCKNKIIFLNLRHHIYSKGVLKLSVHLDV
jgi:hypothetical protein